MNNGKKMKWVTKKEVKAAAKRGRRAALKCTQKHWWQLKTATEDQLRAGRRSHRASIQSDRCALCVRYLRRPKTTCPLASASRCKGVCHPRWVDASAALCAFETIPSDCNFWAWQKCAGEMYQLLMTL